MMTLEMEKNFFDMLAINFNLRGGYSHFHAAAERAGCADEILFMFAKTFPLETWEEFDKIFTYSWSGGGWEEVKKIWGKRGWHEDPKGLEGRLLGRLILRMAFWDGPIPAGIKENFNAGFVYPPTFGQIMKFWPDKGTIKSPGYQFYLGMAISALPEGERYAVEKAVSFLGGGSNFTGLHYALNGTPWEFQIDLARCIFLQYGEIFPNSIPEKGKGWGWDKI